VSDLLPSVQISMKKVKESGLNWVSAYERIGWQSRNKPLFIGKRMLLPLYSDGFDFSLIAITDDWGETWHFSEPIVGAGSIQPSLACVRTAQLLPSCVIMAAPKRLMKSVSNDTGKTWSTVEDSDIPNPGTAADVVVLKSGNWALVHNDIEERKAPLVSLALKRRREDLALQEDPGRGIPGSEVRGHYPAIIQGKTE